MPFIQFQLIAFHFGGGGIQLHLLCMFFSHINKVGLLRICFFSLLHLFGSWYLCYQNLKSLVDKSLLSSIDLLLFFQVSTVDSLAIKFVIMTASPLTCLKDHPRKGEKLTLSPSGTLAAITDSLGRILLLDTQALVVVRLWKVCPFTQWMTLKATGCLQALIGASVQGYRDASCLFVEMLVNRDTAASSSYHEYVKSDYCLCLAIHAPRKGIVEVLISVLQIIYLLSSGIFCNCMFGLGLLGLLKAKHTWESCLFYNRFPNTTYLTRRHSIRGPNPHQNRTKTAPSPKW